MVTVKLEHLQQVLLPSVAIIAVDVEVPDVDAPCGVAADQLHIVHSESHRRDSLLVRECAFARATALHSRTLLRGLIHCSGRLLHPSEGHLIDVKIVAGKESA